LPVAAIFDIDGTLVTFRFDVQGTRRALIGELAARGFDTSGLSLTSPTQQILDAASSQVASGKVVANFAELRKEIYSILDEFEWESVASTSVFPGTRKVLEYLKSKKVRLSVLTNSGRRASSEALRRADLLDCFEFVLTRDDTEAMKPRPEGLEKAISMLGIPRDGIYYVGDSTYDVRAAKLAGLKVVSVATGNYSAERLRAEGADFVVTSVSELPRVLGV